VAIFLRNSSRVIGFSYAGLHYGYDDCRAHCRAAATDRRHGHVLQRFVGEFAHVLVGQLKAELLVNFAVLMMNFSLKTPSVAILLRNSSRVICSS